MLRAAIYARCSTEEESQIDALKNQVAEARECVRQQGWTLVDEYVESKSGTTTKGRSEYNRLFGDLSKDKFDIIVIKSQDRLMRNTKDWYLFVDRLTTSRKRLYMYIDRKFYTTDDALITGIKAILAEDYSRELSKKINNAHRNRQKNGGKPVLTSNVYGLRKRSDGAYELIPEEAQIKLQMYELFDAGYGSRTVCNILKNQGVVNRRGVPFTAANILRMVKNPLNMGTVVMNKVHYDFEIKKNFPVPEEEWFIYPQKVPAIVSEELWMRVNQKIRERSVAKKQSGSRLGKNPGKYNFSGKLVCGICGKPYYRTARAKNGNDQTIYDWKCSTYLEEGRNGNEMVRPKVRKVKLTEKEGCDNVHLNEEKLNRFLEEICEKRYQPDKKKIQKRMLKILEKVLKEQDHQPEIDREIARKERLESAGEILLEKLLSGVVSDEIYLAKQTVMQGELKAINEKIKELEGKKEQGRELSLRMQQIEAAFEEKHFLEKASLTRMLEEISEIVIFPEAMEIHFSYQKLLGISGAEKLTEAADEILKIEYGSYFNPRQQQRENLQAVVDLMKENPRITAKEIAAKAGITTSGAQQRITKLKKENRIRFVGKGGKGYWEVLEG